jgi:hypothetical protein
MSGGQYLSLPASANGLAPVSGASAWAFGTWVTASSTLPTGIRIVGISLQTTYKPGLDVTNEIFLEIGTGASGSELTKIQVPYSQRKDSAIGYFETEIYNMFFPEPFFVSGGSRIAVRITDNVASALTYSGVKIFYIEDTLPTVTLVDPPNWFDGNDTMPEFRFLASDTGGKPIEYELDFDTVNTFNTTPRPWDIENMVWDNKTFSDATLINCYGFCLSADGTKIYACDNVSPYHINQYDLVAPWDEENAVFSGKFYDFSAVGTAPEGIRFNPSGTTCYIVSNVGVVRQFILSTAWDISTATYATKTFTFGGTNSHSLWFKVDDGTKVFTLDRSTAILRQYHLTTPGDISTCVYDSSYNFTPVTTTQTFSFVFRDQGNRLFIVDNGADTMYQYILTTPWDISTLQYDGRLYLDPGAFMTYSVISVNEDGTKFFGIAQDPSFFIYGLTVGVASLHKLRTRENDGFLDTSNSSALHPFASGHLISYTAQIEIPTQQFFWRIRAKVPSTGNAFGAWSEIRQFDIWPMQTVALNSPADGSNVTDTMPVLEFTGSNPWSKDLDYHIQIDSVNTFNSKANSTGLLAQWTMNEADLVNAVLSESMNGLVADVYGCLSVAGIRGEALILNGISDYLKASNTGLPTTGQAFTIAVWILDDTDGATLASGYHRIVSWSNGTAQIQLGMGDGDSPSTNRKFYIVDGSGASSAKKTSDGNATTGWHHLVATCDGSAGYHLYVDGAVSESGSINGSGNTYNGDSTHVFIGQRGDNFGYVSGLIDETRIYNRELTAAEVLNLYNQNATIGRFSENDTGFVDPNPVSVNHEICGNYYNGGTSGDTASLTPDANKLYLITVASRTGISVDPVQPTITGCSLTWVAIGSVIYDTTSSSRRRVTLFRAMGSSPTIGVLTIDFASQAQTNFGWIIDLVNNVDTSGTNGSGAIVQSSTAVDDSETVDTLTATLAVFSNTANATYGAVGTGAFYSNPPITTPGSGFTIIASNTEDGGNTCHTLVKNTNDTTVEITFDQVNSIGTIAIELKAQLSGRPFPSSNQISYTVQAVDVLTPGTYYWRARAVDTKRASSPGSGIFSAYSAVRSFTINAASAGIKTINGLAKASIKTWNGLANASVKNLQ